MKVQTPAGTWESREDFDASASIQSLTSHVVSEMNLNKGGYFEMIDGAGRVIHPADMVGLYCDSYLELVATGSAV